MANPSFFSYSKNPCRDVLFLYSSNRPFSWTKLATACDLLFLIAKSFKMQMQMTWPLWKRSFLFSKHHPYCMCELHWDMCVYKCVNSLNTNNLRQISPIHFSHFMQRKTRIIKHSYLKVITTINKVQYQLFNFRTAASNRPTEALMSRSFL